MTEFSPALQNKTGVRRQRFGQYELTSVLGLGAATVVYEAQHGGNAYAIKLIRDDRIKSSTMRLAFRREAAALARIRHSSIPSVIEMGELDGEPYLVLELIRGRTLAEELTKEPLTEARLRAVGGSVAAALSAAHGRGLVHRDVKPANLMLEGTDDRVRLIDFSLAQASFEEVADDSTIAGTFVYAAPEQTGMLSRPVDARSDLYSLGVTLYEAAAGRPPFVTSDLADLLRKHATEPPPDLRLQRPDLSEELCRIIERLLAKDPDNRYQTAYGLLKDLASDEDAGEGEAFAPGGFDSGQLAPSVVPLVGRDAELKTLREAFHRTAEGVGGLVVIDADAGVGKSRLLQALIEEAREEDALVLQGRAAPEFRGLLDPIQDALDFLLRYGGQRRDGPELIRQAAGEAAPVVARLSPQLRELLDVRGDSELSTQQLMDTMVEFLRRLALEAGHALLVLDDMHLAGEATTSFLFRLAESLGTCPLLVVAAGRSSADAGAYARLLSAAAGAHTRLTLGPLPRDGIKELVEAHLSGGLADGAFVDHVLVRSGGNPLIVSEYLQACFDAGILVPSMGRWLVDGESLAKLELPQDLLELILQRFHELGEQSHQILGEAALIGRRFDLSLLNGLNAHRPQEVMQALGDALGAKLIEAVGPSEYAFVHDGVLDVVLSSIDGAERARVHQRIAVVLEEQRGERSLREQYAIAQHYARGVPTETPERAYLANQEAGEAALAHFDVEEAGRFFTQAKELSERCGIESSAEVDIGLGDVSTLEGRVADAVRCYDKALLRLTEPWTRARVQLNKAKALLSNREMQRATEALHLGFAEVGVPAPASSVGRLVAALRDMRVATRMDAKQDQIPAVSDERRRELKVLLQMYDTAYVLLYYRIDKLAMVQAIIHPLKLALEYGPSRELVRAYGAYALLYGLVLKNPEKTQYFSDRAMRCAEELGDPSAVASAQRAVCLSRAFLGSSPERELAAHFEQVLEQHGPYMDAFDFDSASSLLCWHLSFRGYSNEAAAVMGRSIERLDGEDVRLSGLIAHARGNLALAAAFLGDAKVAYENLPDVDASFAESRYHAAYHVALRPLILFELSEPLERVEEALTAWEKAGVTLRHSTDYLRHYWFVKAMVRLVALEQRRDEASKQAAEQAAKELEKAKGKSKILEAHSLWVSGAIARHQGNYDKALQLLSAAEDLGRQIDAPWTLYEVARQRAFVFHEQGFPHAVEDQLRAAMDLADSCGWSRRSREIRDLGRNLAVKLLEGSSERTRFGSTTGASASATSGVMAVKRVLKEEQFDALLQVSLAAGTPGDVEQKSQKILAELIRLLCGERAFLFGVNDDGTFSISTGRDDGGGALPNATDYSATVLKRVRDTGQPVIMTSDASGEVSASESVQVYGLKSIIAAPMVVRERLVGIVYLDSRVAKGMFSEGQVTLLVAMANHIAVAIETARSAQVEMEKGLLEKDIAITATLQLLLIPQAAEVVTPDLSLAAAYQPAAQSGGDWWWYTERPDGTRLVLVGDVTGHGPGPAMVTAAMASCVQVLDYEHGGRYSPDQLIHAMNRSLSTLCRGEYHAVLTALLIDAEANKATAWLLGGLPILALLPDGSTRAFGAQGSPLGAGAEIETSSIELPWEPGTRLLLHTDGISETYSPTGRQMGLKRLLKQLVQTRELSTTEARQALLDFTVSYSFGAPQEDDVTFVVLDRPA